MTVILDGRETALGIRKELARKIGELQGIQPMPGLAVVLLGDDPASRAYVNLKTRACRKLGIGSYLVELPGETEESRLLEVVDNLNQDPQVTGILVQLPLPDHINANRVLLAISPDKDVDGFHPVNVGRLVQGQPGFRPCTPFGIIKLLEAYQVPIEGKRAVVIGRSNIVGKPMAQMLLARNATVSICHTHTTNLAEIVGLADILVVAAGVPGLVRGAWVKPGAAVIDVGQNRIAEGVLVGDVDFEAAAARAGWITPVPGGVGPMTVAMLMWNTVMGLGG